MVTDASLMGLLLQSGVPAANAAVAAIMARICTLWLSVTVGSVFLVINRNSITLKSQEAMK